MCWPDFARLPYRVFQKLRHFLIPAETCENVFQFVYPFFLISSNVTISMIHLGINFLGSMYIDCFRI